MQKTLMSLGTSEVSKLTMRASCLMLVPWAMKESEPET